LRDALKSALSVAEKEDEKNIPRPDFSRDTLLKEGIKTPQKHSSAPPPPEEVERILREGLPPEPKV
jgi:hypothetical protein